MDAFETIIAAILEYQAFWMRTSVKVELSEKEKQTIGRATSPRWELDVVAYNPLKNVLWIVECKSFLDSHGVRAAAFREGSRTSRFKLFNEPKTRETVFEALKRQWTAEKLILPKPDVTLCLAAGKIAGDAEELRQVFQSNNWKLIEPDWISQQLKEMSHRRYQNSVIMMTAKLLRDDQP